MQNRSFIKKSTLQPVNLISELMIFFCYFTNARMKGPSTKVSQSRLTLNAIKEELLKQLVR